MNSLQKKILGISVLLLVALAFFYFSTHRETYTSISHATLISQEYVGSFSCKECHHKEYQEWKRSDHFKAMQIADDSTILGDFNNATYTADGITSRFFKKNNKFYIHTQSQEGIYKDYEILFTFGHYPLQQYLTAFEGGKMQVLRQSWDSRQKKWFHQYQGQIIAHDDWLHWTGNSQNWNMMCATCHSTNLKKNYDSQTDTYHTTYSEVTIGCESCHGAGKQHITQMKSPTYKQGKSVETFILSKPNMNQQESLQTCFPCHSRRGEMTQHHVHSTEIMDNFIPEIPAKNIYFADGQAYDEVYKYGSFLQSKMYQAGVTCTDCHNPHTGKLKAQGNALCLQCHTPNYATYSHTFHKDEKASDCRSCHMPTRTYMGNDVRHDHNFAVPRPDLSEKYNVPNACNDCHTDKTPQWASNAVKKWYGDQRKPHFAENLILASEQNTQSLEYIHQLLSEPTTPHIIRATAVHYLGGIPLQESYNLIINELQATDPQTRYRAIQALMNFSIENDIDTIIPFLRDKVKSIRVATAHLLLSQLGIEQVLSITHFKEAQSELEIFLHSQSDFAIGSASLGDYYAKTNRIEDAVKFYKRALSKDKKLNYVRLNLAMLYNQKQENNLALQILNEALIFEPQNPQIHYYLALLYHELNQLETSKKSFEQALQLGLKNERIMKNYQLLLLEMKTK